MARLPSKEQDDNWTGHGLSFDPHKLNVQCGPADENGNRLVIASLYGDSHRDCFNTDIAFKRQKFREKCYSVFGVDDESIHEAIETAIIERSDAADSRAEGTSIYQPAVTMLDTVKPEKVEWLWKNRIAIGKNNLLGGDPGLGKSLFSLDIAARVSSGNNYPDGAINEHGPSGVVILTMEDDAADTIVPRLIAHNADLSRIALVQGLTETDGDGTIVRGIDLAHDIKAIRAAIQQVPNCKLIVVDTIADYIGEKTDSHKNRDVRSVMNPFASLATELRLANLCLAHLRKSEGKAVHSMMGSIAFVGQSRVAWAITRCHKNPKRRLMTCIKNNLADDTSGLAYTIEPYGKNDEPVLAWEAEPVRMSADEAMAAVGKKRGPAPKQRDDAAEWLRGELCGGPKAAGVILDEGDSLGFSATTVRRAFRQLDCQRRKGGFNEGWLWSLPEDAIEDHDCTLVRDNLAPSNLRANTEDNHTEPTYISCSRAKAPSSESGKDEVETFEADWDWLDNGEDLQR